MRVLIACEFSGTLRDAFLALGHDAFSCDLLPSERPGPHYQEDVRLLLDDGWDLMVAFPPCTYLSRAGARWDSQPGRDLEIHKALLFVFRLLDAPIPHIALENPIGKISTHYRAPDQTIQPWMFGHPQTKATCLWLKNLPHLVPTEIVEGRSPISHMAPDSKHRWKNRSRTLPGIAHAMASQWGKLEPTTTLF